MTDTTKALRMALEALEAQHRDRTAYGRAKRKANATCAEFKNSPMKEIRGGAEAGKPQAEPVADELGWLIEMRPSENLLWWDGGFDVSDDYPSKRLFARMVNDVNKAVRFSRREDAQCVLDAMLAVRPSPLFARASTLYSVQEHMWIAPTQPQQATPIGRVSRWGKRADGKPWMEAEFPQDGSADLPAGTPLYVAAQPLQPPQDELDQAKARIASLELEMRKIRPSLRGIFDRDLWDSLD